MVARLQFSALCIAHGRVPPRCAQTHTHTVTCAHTQVSTLPPADRIGLKDQCTATDTFKLLKTNIQAFMNPAEIFSSVGSTMRPNENGYNRRGNRTYVQNVRTENSEIDLASIFYLFP